MADITTTITELLDNSDVQKKIAQAEAKEKSLAKITAERGKVTAQVLRQELRDRDRAERGVMSFTQALSVNAEQTGRMTAATGNLRAQFVDLAVQLQGGASPFTALSQQLPQIAEAAIGTSGALGTFASSVASAATTGATVLLPFLSVAAPLWLDYADAQKRATDEAEAWAAIQEGSKPALDRIQADIEALIELTRGAETVEEERNRIVKEYSELLDEQNAPLKERIRLLEEETDLNKEGQTVTGVNYEENRRELAKLNQELKTNNERAAQGLTAALAVAEYEREAAESARVLAERKKAEAAARTANKQAIKDEAEELDFLQGIYDKIEGGFQFSAPDIFEGVETFEDAQKRMAAAAQKRADAVAALEQLQQQKMLAWGDTAAKAVSSIESVIEAVVKDRAEYVQDAQDDYEEALEEGDAATIASAKRRLTAEKQAAMKAWEIQQAAAFATAVAMAAQGIAVAAAAYPPPANVPAIAAAALTGAANVAVVAANPPPEFDDTPGVIQAQGGNRSMASFKRGDYVVAAQDPAKLIQQAMAPLMKGAGRRQEYGGGQQVRTTVFIGANRAAQIDAVARLGRRGPARGQRPLGRRVASTGGSG